MVPILDKFYRNRCILNLCQTGPLTPEQIAQSMEISPSRVSQLDSQFQEAGEAGLVVKKATGAPSKLTTEQRVQYYRQNPQQVAEWQEKTLPELKKTAVEENRRIFYVDESAFYLLPQPGQTWAPAGQTPILRDGGRYTHLSVMSAISSQGHLYYQLQRTSYTGSEIAKFIRDLCQLNPQPLLIIWDAAKIHRSQEMKDWLRTDNRDGRVQLAILPAY